MGTTPFRPLGVVSRNRKALFGTPKPRLWPSKQVVFHLNQGGRVIDLWKEPQCDRGGRMYQPFRGDGDRLFGGHCVVPPVPLMNNCHRPLKPSVGRSAAAARCHPIASKGKESGPTRVALEICETQASVTCLSPLTSLDPKLHHGRRRSNTLANLAGPHRPEKDDATC